MYISSGALVCHLQSDCGGVLSKCWHGCKSKSRAGKPRPNSVLISSILLSITDRKENSARKVKLQVLGLVSLWGHLSKCSEIVWPSSNHWPSPSSSKQDNMSAGTLHCSLTTEILQLLLLSESEISVRTQKTTKSLRNLNGSFKQRFYRKQDV